MQANQIMYVKDMPISTVFALHGILWRKVTSRTCEVIPVNSTATWAKRKRYYFTKGEWGVPVLPTTETNKYR